MTTQTKLVIAGTAAGLAAKFYWKQPTIVAIMVGLGVISAYAILTADTPDAPAN